MIVEGQEYIATSGKNPYRDWVINVDAGFAARISSAILRIGLGNFSQAKRVGSGVHEVRLDFGPATASISARMGKHS